MTCHPQSRPGWLRAILRSCLVFLCLGSVVLGGCAERKAAKARTFPWASAKAARPRIPTFGTAGDTGTDSSEIDDDREVDVSPPPSPLVLARSVPARPRVAAAPVEQPEPGLPEAPQIVPQLTPEETAEAQRQTSSGVGIAERNLASSRGHNLNPSQADLVSKVRSFLAEAREAARVGDWTRARSAAKKAQVLSEDLSRSFQ